MIEFREINYEKDISEIVALLNANFESTHTQKGFLWKHAENPFGKSYGLLATENNKIIGLRMFMRWEFTKNEQRIRAIRPVDTCTDHAYRGRGLFKKLTLQGLENIRDEYELIFNTPNSNSRPGYLKMGWKVIAEPDYYFGFINPFASTSKYDVVSSSQVDFKENWKRTNKYVTRLSPEYISWRYSDEKYHLAQFIDGSLLIFKILRLKGIKTIVLVDLLGDEKKFTQMVSSVSRKNAAPGIYFSNRVRNKNLNLMFKTKRDSQVVVSKDDSFGISREIDFSEGDLEGTL